METMDHKIKRLALYYSHIYETKNPVIIARNLGIMVYVCPLGNISGNYKLLKRKRWIFVNEEIDRHDPFFKVVVAHELGHAIFHRKENCAFIKRHTLLLTSGIESEANLFASYLLIDSDMLEEYSGFTIEQFCNNTGYPEELVKLRLK